MISVLGAPLIRSNYCRLKTANSESSATVEKSIDSCATKVEKSVAAAAAKPYRAVELVGGINAHLRSKGLDQVYNRNAG